MPMGDPVTQVLRDALLDRMADAGHKQLITVTAPAGYGKSTFLAQWIAHADLQNDTVWISLDTQDNDPLVFWNYVMNGLDRVSYGACKNALMQLAAAPENRYENALITLMNALAAIQKKMVLVLDDFHLITNPVIHDGINFLIDHPIPQFTMVLSTRIKPFTGISRLRISGTIKEINASDLQFSKKETLDFMACFSSKAVNQSQADHLQEKTEGWVAALKLAMISDTGITVFQEASVDQNRQVLETYLMEEVFSTLPDSIQRFLIQINILDQFNASICRKITGDDRALEHLSFIHKHHLFLISLDNDQEWYRFHHLFRDFLTHQQTLFSVSEMKTLHEQAFFWLEANDYFKPAFEHALQAGRPDLAARFFAQKAPQLYSQGGEQAFDELFGRLSMADILNEPVLACYYYSILTWRLEFEAIDDMAVLLERDWPDREYRIIEGFYACLKAYVILYKFGDFSTTLELSAKAAALIPDDHTAIHRLMDFMDTLCYRFLGQIEPALALSRPRPDEPFLSSALAAMNRSGLEIELGWLSDAHDLLEKEIGFVEECFGRDIPPMYGFLYINYGMVFKELHQLEKARLIFEKGISIIDKTGFIELIIISYGEYSKLLAALGEFDKAHAAIDKVIGLVAQSQSPFLSEYFDPYKSWIWIKEKKFDLIQSIVENATVETLVHIPFLQSAQYLVWIRYFIEKKIFDKALHLLEIMMNEDRTCGRNSRLIECLVLKSKIFWVMGESAESFDWIIQAFELTRNQGHIHIFVTEFEDHPDFFQDCRKRNLLPTYLKTYFDSQHKSQQSSTVAAVEIQEFMESFNTREIEILKLFQSGASNKEAADALYLSVNTVRWYASNLFAKLSVKRRGQAVSKASQLGLI